MKKFKKILYTMIILFICLMITSGCSSLRTKQIEGNGEFVTKTYNNLIGNEITIKNIYTGKDKSGKAIVHIYPSENQQIIVTAQENIVKYIDVKSKTNELTIDGGSSSYYVTDEIKIDIYGYTFKEIILSHCEGSIDEAVLSKEVEVELDNASDITIEKFEGTKLDLDLSGASQCTINDLVIDSIDVDESGASSATFAGIFANNVNLDLSGASKLKMEGTIVKLDSELSGASILYGGNLLTTECDFNMSGGSSATLIISTTLEYELSGGSDLNYYGDPKKSGHVSGGSKVNQLTKE